MTPAAREVAGLAAAVGRKFTLDLLTEASDLDADSVVRAVDELWRRRIVREFRDGYDFSHDLLRDTATSRSARRGAGCCTGASPRASNCCTPTTPTRSRRSSPSSTPAAGAPSGRWRYYRRAAEVAAERFAHAEAIRLHAEALDDRARAAGGPGPGRAGAGRPRGDGGATQRRGTATRPPSCSGTLERAVALAERSGARTRCCGLVGLWASRFVAGAHRRRPRRSRRAPCALVEPDLRAERPGPLRRGRGGGQPREAPAEALRHFAARRRQPPARCIAERRHPARRARPGLGGARPLAARRR